MRIAAIAVMTVVLVSLAAVSMAQTTVTGDVSYVDMGGQSITVLGDQGETVISFTKDTAITAGGKNVSPSDLVGKKVSAACKEVDGKLVADSITVIEKEH